MRTLVLLTWDERPGLEVLLPRLQQLRVDEMLCVDGGSQDGTRELLQDRGIRVLDQPRRGRGEAFRVGAAHARGDYLVYFSPDGNEDPNDIEKLFTALEGGADMAIASRFLPGARNEEDGQRWPLRKWVNLAFTWIANVLWNRGHWISDTINGFRGIRRQLFLSLDTRSMGYTIEYELSIGCMRRRLNIQEVATIEAPRLFGETKGDSWPVGKAFTRFLLEEVWADLARVPVRPS